MDGQGRLEELYSYKVLDTSPDKELDELIEIASAICDTPISLLSLVDSNRQWFKAKKGIKVSETDIDHSFCKHTIISPQEVLVVEDSLTDERFKHNPLVLGEPNIRFYAGAPLQTPTGHVLGTLCIIDTKPRSISENQKKALQLLAKKAMDFLESRKLIIEQKNKIRSEATRLLQLTDHVPGAIFQFEMTPEGKISLPFISQGIKDVYPSLTPEFVKENPEKIFEYIHAEDLPKVRQSVLDSFLTVSNWIMEFRVITQDNSTLWIYGSSRPERQEDGSVVWYGSLTDTTVRKEYITTLEKVLLDISHLMQRPMADMLTLTEVLHTDAIDKTILRSHAEDIKSVSTEMDTYIRKLNMEYQNLKIKVVAPKQNNAHFLSSASINNVN